MHGESKSVIIVDDEHTSLRDTTSIIFNKKDKYGCHVIHNYDNRFDNSRSTSRIMKQGGYSDPPLFFPDKSQPQSFRFAAPANMRDELQKGGCFLKASENEIIQLHSQNERNGVRKSSIGV
jgi:hypothetical protein